jgi:hypothetical protein
LVEAVLGTPTAEDRSLKVLRRMPTQKLAASAAARISRSRQTVRRDGHASRLD